MRDIITELSMQEDDLYYVRCRYSHNEGAGLDMARFDTLEQAVNFFPKAAGIFEKETIEFSKHFAGKS